MNLSQFFRRSASIVPRKQERLVIVGSGWAGFKLLESIDQKKYDVVVISPRNYFVFTPLLASTSVGTLEFRAIVEPVRRQAKKLPNGDSSLTYYEAGVSSIDFTSKRVECASVLNGQDNTFSVGYDKLVIACGAVSNTFNIPGVQEHACFLKDIHDARKIRYRIMECFEKASQPEVSEEEKKQLLHFVTVGGGPTGIEFSAELHDLLIEDLLPLYPNLKAHCKMTVIDVAPKILSTFDASLADYTVGKFSRKGINIRTGVSVKRVEGKDLHLANGEVVPYGLLVWATGLTQAPLVKNMDPLVWKDPRSGRIGTDNLFRVIKTTPDVDSVLQNLKMFEHNEKSTEKAPSASLTVMDDVFAIGDCAMIPQNDLPATAQVAKQKANYLAKMLNAADGKHMSLDKMAPFQFHDAGALAYIGGWRAIARLSFSNKKNINKQGVLAWLIWRSAYMTMSVSWRNKILIPVYWFLAWCFGRDISHLK